MGMPQWTHGFESRPSDVLHRVRLLVVDPLVSEDVDQLLDDSIIRRAEASIVCQWFFRMVHLEYTAAYRANKDGQEL